MIPWALVSYRPDGRGTGSRSCPRSSPVAGRRDAMQARMSFSGRAIISGRTWRFRTRRKRPCRSASRSVAFVYRSLTRCVTHSPRGLSPVAWDSRKSAEVDSVHTELITGRSRRK